MPCRRATREAAGVPERNEVSGERSYGASSCVARGLLKAAPFGDDAAGAIFDFVEDASDVLAEDAKRDELNAGDKKDDEDESREPFCFDTAAEVENKVTDNADGGDGGEAEAKPRNEHERGAGERSDRVPGEAEVTKVAEL